MDITYDHAGLGHASRRMLIPFEGQTAASIGIHNNKRGDSTNNAASGFSLPPTLWTFPYRLMEMIKWCESEQADKEGASLVVCWSPGGEYFVINNKEKLSTHVLRRFFKDSKFASFQRKLYRWGFKQVSPKRDAYKQSTFSFYVDGFERDNPSSCFDLKVRYSKREKEDRRQKSLEAKQKKSKKQVTTLDVGTIIERRNNVVPAEQEPSQLRLIWTAPSCNGIAAGQNVMAVPQVIQLAPIAELPSAPDTMVLDNAHANRSQAELAAILVQCHSERLAGCIPASGQHISQSGNPFYGASSCQQRSILSNGVLAELFELRKMVDTNAALRGIHKLRELQQLGHSLQMWPIPARTSLDALLQIQAIGSDMAALRGIERGCW
jgi:hypothetical protein